MIGFLVLLATVHESWRMYYGTGFSVSDNAVVSVLHCFSALNNGRKVLSLKSAGSNSDNLSCLHGIRFFSTCWVVLGHTWLKAVMSNVLNPKMVIEVNVKRSPFSLDQLTFMFHFMFRKQCAGKWRLLLMLQFRLIPFS